MSKNETNREALAKIAALVRPALATQTYIPAYNHICFDGERATAFNDIGAIQVLAPVPIERCVPGELFIRALASFGGDNVMIQEGAGDSTLLVSSGRSKLKLPTMALKDFPFEIPKDEGPEIGIDRSMLNGIERCLLSAGTNPTHPAQMGVTLDISSDKPATAVLYSTDNFTISRYYTGAKIKLPGDSPVIMPTFFCEQLLALAKAFPDAPITLFLLPGALLAEFGSVATLFIRTLVNPEPIDFNKIISKHLDPLAMKDKLEPIPDAFDGAFGRAMLVLGGELDKVTKISYDDGVMKLHSSSAMGDSDDSINFPEGPNKPLEFFVDPQLIVRASKGCSSIALLPKVLVLADPDAKFLHLIAHCAA